MIIENIGLRDATDATNGVACDTREIFTPGIIGHTQYQDTAIIVDMDQKQRSHLQLVVRHREISAFRDVLRQVRQMPLKQKQKWLDANAEAMQSAFSIFVDVSERTLDEMLKNNENMELSYQLVTTLREAEALVAEVFHQPSAQLQS